MIPFAEADIKKTILRTLFPEKKRQNIIIQDFTKNCKHSFNAQLTSAPFTTLIEKKYPFFDLFTKLIQKHQGI